MTQSIMGMIEEVDFFANTATTSDTGSTCDVIVSTPVDVKSWDHILLITRAMGGTDSDATATWQLEYQTSYPAYSTLPASDYAADASTDIWLNWTGATNGTVTVGSCDAISAPQLMDINVADVIGTAGGSIRLKFTPGQPKMKFCATGLRYGGTRHMIGGNATTRVVK